MSNKQIQLTVNKKQILAGMTLLLMLTFSMMFAALPAANASNPPIEIPTYAYLAISPDPVGVGQNVFLVMWLHMAPPTAAGDGGDR